MDKYISNMDNTISNKRLKVCFFWFGIDGRYGQWKDGLWKAMKIIEKDHDVTYLDVTPESIKKCHELSPDIVLFWEASCTSRGQDAEMYWSVCKLPFKKALLFAGGPLEAIDVYDFDIVFVESQINAEDCERQGIKWRTAFGVNDDIFFPQELPKVFTSTYQATCASWKRQGLVAEALGRNVVFCGRDQKSDPQPFIDARKYSLVLPELPMEAVATLLNSSDVVVNAASFWGGGQRCTLEALACNIPVICCDDSPKNMEYVIESGCGTVCQPNVESIRQAVLKVSTENYGDKGVNYIKNKWSAQHYADSLLAGIQEIL